MLGLRCDTDPAWLATVERDVGALLRDHAHCELKAAHSALSILGRWGGQYPRLVGPLGALAREEIAHFEAVVARLDARGLRLEPPASDPFVVALRRAGADRDPSVPPLLDRLLVCALVEARSAERFAMLARGLSDGELRAFYRELLASEARHYRLFVDLAEQCFGREAARARLDVLAERESAIARDLGRQPTVHG
ncbi:MAG: tRNA-(ms[2]io[6]A)-hydroxylase [Myxococcota bacterium]|nr:tRNA-(ms[2]io[6]A)-hydroxylase [Myxococcota bacterium]MDW8362759.1 tRNA isopentenyl-2-thiomethyl-A-37 hydroxylase MiaE [Myxococcales bacterium]